MDTIKYRGIINGVGSVSEISLKQGFQQASIGNMSFGFSNAFIGTHGYLGEVLVIINPMPKHTFLLTNRIVRLC